MLRGLVTGVVDQVNGSRAGHNVDGGSKNKESRANDDADEVVLEVEPQLVNFLRVHLRSLDDDDGH